MGRGLLGVVVMYWPIPKPFSRVVCVNLEGEMELLDPSRVYAYLSEG